MDLSKLSPVPWTVVTDAMGAGVIGPGAFDLSLADAEFIALARHALEVKMRRGWTSMQVPNGWAAVTIELEKGSGFIIQWVVGKRFISADPDTCLVEADAYAKSQGL